VGLGVVGGLVGFSVGLAVGGWDGDFVGRAAKKVVSKKDPPVSTPGLAEFPVVDVVCSIPAII
jgi:hypothetical protein